MTAAAAAPAAPQQKTDVLEDDFVTVPGQQYALVSFVSPDGRQKSSQCGMKLRGVFNTREEAAAHVKKLQRYDGTFDIFLLEMYKWVAIPPDVEKIDDVKYQEDFLEELVSSYKENQELAKQHFRERKQIVQEQGLAADPQPFSVPSPSPVADPVFTQDATHPSSTLPPVVETADGAGPSGASSSS